MRNLLVTYEDDDSCPLPARDDVLDLYAGARSVSQPFDFATQCGVAINKLAVQVEMNRSDVLLVVLCTGLASYIRPGQHRAVLFLRHLLDYHGHPHQVKTQARYHAEEPDRRRPPRCDDETPRHKR